MKRILSIIPIVALGLLLASCSKDEETLLQNDVLKKTYGPNVVGNEIEFAYVMAVPGSTLESAHVEASIPGAAGTGFEENAYYTDAAGKDVPVKVASECKTEGARSQATLIDTMAVTLRYHYVIPEEARGQNLSFTFTAKARNGETVSYRVDNQKVARQYMKKGIELTAGDRCYISIEDMAAYTLDEVTSQNLAGKIDLIYHYKVLNVAYNHVFLSPGTDPLYLEDAVVPSNATNLSKVERQIYTFDRHLVIDPSKEISAGGYSYVDDIDFQTYDPGNALSFALDFNRAGQSLWVIPEGGARKAFIQVNSLSAGKMTVSMKMYQF